MFSRFRQLFTGAMLALVSVSAASSAAPLPELRIAVLKFGTVNWLMQTITDRGFDTANGFRLTPVPLAGGAATAIAFQAGDVDLIVKDWFWALHLRARGRDIRFSPFSSALGSVMTHGTIRDLCDLKGQRIGVVGGPHDKSWLVLRALARTRCGFDLAAETTALFGAPPLLSQQLKQGTVAAVSTYWHYAARLKAEGAAEVIRITDAVGMLGIEPTPALIGFIWDKAHTPARTMAGFLAAVRAAQAVLADDDTAWASLRPLMRVPDEATFSALRAGYRAGIVGRAFDTAAAAQLYDIMAAEGGAAFLSGTGPFDAGLFAPPGE